MERTMSEVAAEAKPFKLKKYRLPRLAIFRFVARRSAVSAIVCGAIFAAYTASKVLDYVKLYSTETQRQKLAESLGNNVGIEAILGVAHHIDTVPGYAAWNMLCILSAGAAIWGLLLATRHFRGEEESGRTELLLTGQTTMARSALSTLAGLGVAWWLFFGVAAAGFVSIGHARGVGFSPRAAVFMALAVTSSGGMFIAVGALMSQLVPVRARATGFGAAIFGVFYLLRILADTTSAHWLLDLTPLGWVERLQPLYDSRAIWLVSIAAFIFVVSVTAILLAKNRDLGDSLLADRDTARPHLKLLNSPLGAMFRLTRSSVLGWLVAVTTTAAFYGFLTKSATQAFSARNARHLLNTITHSSAVGSEFLGLIFMLQMVMLMSYAVAAASGARNDEAQGYLDNLLVRNVSRARWFLTRASLMIGALIAASVLVGLITWAAVASQHIGVSFYDIFMAALNMLPPAVLVLGLTLFVFGFLPRMTSLAGYAVIGWSFLLLMLESGLKLNHWILDTSILQHVVLAPAKSPDWHTNFMLVVVAIAAGLLGLWRFTGRDLQTE
jgi:ABC-2 type transport system permease protein